MFLSLIDAKLASSGFIFYLPPDLIEEFQKKLEGFPSAHAGAILTSSCLIPLPPSAFALNEQARPGTYRPWMGGTGQHFTGINAAQLHAPPEETLCKPWLPHNLGKP